MMATLTSGDQIRVLVVATSVVSRGGLETIVRKAEHLSLVGSIAGLSALGAHVRHLQPDVILAELDPDDLTVIERSINSDQIPPTVALVDHPEASWIAHALQRGIKAILPRAASAREILLAIESAHSSLVLLESATAQQLWSRTPSRTDVDFDPYDELTERELEVLRMLAEGLGNKQIASQLGISEHTVKFHISSILDKFGASSRTEAVTMGIRQGLILV